MKKILLSFFLLIMSYSIYGQEIQIAVAPTLNDFVILKSFDTKPSFGIRPGFNLEINYFRKTDNKISVGFGINYQYAQVYIDYSNVDIFEPPPVTDVINLISLSVLPTYKFKKQFYLNINPSFDFELNHSKIQDKQSGIGLSIGFGKRIKIKDKHYISIEPKIWMHNLITFDNHEMGTRLSTAGLNIKYAFKTKD